MENSTKNTSPNGKNKETNHLKIQESNETISENLDTIAFYLFEAIKRKTNQEIERKGA